nr:SprT family zinc-dependent metalloprotease [Ferrimicrobium acidiphilum]
MSDIEVDVVYKEIKNLHIGVYPPNGRVRVAAPETLDDDQVRLAVITRLSWIKRQRQRLQAAERQSMREMVTGESHYVWGRRYRLKVIECTDRTRIELIGQRLLLYIPVGTTVDRRRDLLDRWYREQLRLAIPPVLAKWEPTLGIMVSQWRIRRMKTKWGSCNREAGRIWFNLELAKKHPEGLEYVLVHEMTHLLERGHGERFIKLMDKVMADWRARQDGLNRAPLGHDEWAAI